MLFFIWFSWVLVEKYEDILDLLFLSDILAKIGIVSECYIRQKMLNGQGVNT